MMLGLLDYCEVLRDLKVDSRLKAIYWHNQEILRTMQVDIARFEREILEDCFAYSGGSIKPSENNRRECYRELGLIIDDTGGIPEPRCDLWEGTVFWTLTGRDLDLKARQHYSIYTLCAATMVIVGYVETLQAGIALDNQAIKTNLLLDLSFLLAKSGFFIGSVQFTEQVKASRRASKSRQAGIQQSFKTKFKENIVYPKWLALKGQGIKRGDKADLIRTVLELYDLELAEAEKRGEKINPIDKTLTPATVHGWIRKFESKR